MHTWMQEHLSGTVFPMISSAENQKGINAVEGCSIETQKGTIAIDFKLQ